MRTLYLIPILAVLLAGPASSQSTWRDQDGKPVVESESMKSKDNFAGSLLATTDEDWKQKWDTPPETKPNFNKAGSVPYGKKVFILTFFSNPQKDANGSVSVKCDFKITDPKGKVTLDQKGMACYEGKLAGDPFNLYLSGPVIGISGDPGDPPGTWVIEVNLQDQNRKTSLPLRTRFQLLPKRDGNS